MRNANVLILTDDAEFARLLTACWQTEKQGAARGRSEQRPVASTRCSAARFGGGRTDARRKGIRHLAVMEPAAAVILCAPADSRELGQLRSKYPRLLHVPLRDDWAQTLTMVAGESLRRTEAVRLAREAERHAQRVDITLRWDAT